MHSFALRSGSLLLTLSGLSVSSLLTLKRVWLAQCGALVDAVDYNQQTALMIAIFSGAAPNSKSPSSHERAGSLLPAVAGI